MKFRFIREHRDQFSVSRMCCVLGVSSSGYYAWCARPESTRSREDRRLRVKIRASHKRSREIYGSPRVHADLVEAGESCGLNRVARLMREEGLTGKKRRRYCVTTDSSHCRPIAPNLLDQEFEVQSIDTVWAGDITYIWTRQGWLYLSVLLDLFSRRVVGWDLSRSLEKDLVLRALNRAVAARRPRPGLIHHSDRGSQYASSAYQDQLTKFGMTASMSRKGNCYDNAVVESFFDSLKTELDGAVFETRKAARVAIANYIEIFYNCQRRHSTIGFKSPAQYEKEAA